MRENDRLCARHRGKAATGLALAAHTGALLVALQPVPLPVSGAAASPPLDIVLDVPELPAPAIAEAALAPERPVAARTERGGARERGPTPHEDKPRVDSESGLPAAAGPAAPWSPVWSVPTAMDLGLHDSSVWSPAGSTEGWSPDAGHAVAIADPGRLREALDEADTARGYGRGGVVVSAVEDEAGEAIRDIGDGTATLEVSTDAQGRVASVRLVASSDERRWSEVAKTVRQALAGRALPVPKSARGLVVAVHVEVARLLPSGARGAVSPLVNLKGVGGSFDVSDIGARPHPVVHARVVSERPLE